SKWTLNGWRTRPQPPALFLVLTFTNRRHYLIGRSPMGVQGENLGARLPRILVTARQRLVTAASIVVRVQRSVVSWTISSKASEEAPPWRVSRRSWTPYLGSLALVILITLFGLPIEQRIAITNVAMLYLLAVVVSALRWGRAPAMIAAVAGTIAFDLFMIPPFMRIGAPDFRYSVTLISLLAIGLLIGTLAGEAREQAETARTAHAATAAMYAFSQSLASSNDLDQIVNTVGNHIVD